jgi:hypothetical protein
MVMARHWISHSFSACSYDQLNTTKKGSRTLGAQLLHSKQRFLHIDLAISVFAVFKVKDGAVEESAS